MGIIFFNGVFQLIGVTSVFPFFALAADPNQIQKSGFCKKLLSLLPPLSNNNLLVIVGCGSIILLFIGTIGNILSEVIRTRYVYGFCHWLRRQLFESYANQSYSFFLKRNSAVLNQKLLDVQVFVLYFLTPLVDLLSRMVLIVMLVGVISIIQPWITLGAVLLFGGFYFSVFLWLRPRSRAVNTGLEMHEVGFGQNSIQFLQGIKTVMVHGKSQFFIDRAMAHSAKIGYFRGAIPIYQNGPRYLIDPIAFGGLVGIVVVKAFQGHSISNILPILSVMALAGYRMLPAIQLFYVDLVHVATNSYTLNQLEKEVFSESVNGFNFKKNNIENIKPIRFENEFFIDNISYCYTDAGTPIFNNFSLLIRKNESIGISGASGSGKSTLVDLMLGLHVPQTGVIRVDGIPLTFKNILSWRKIIGYVQQDIYLLDDTIQANIAFGEEPCEIDLAMVKEAALGAQILDFIEHELPDGFKTTVGERGVRLSGGQRQRIGLARALYHRPQILILDEATSALDQQTELAVMDTINRLQGKLTLIIIAHRLSTLERCDRVVHLSGCGIIDVESVKS